MMNQDKHNDMTIYILQQCYINTCICICFLGAPLESLNMNYEQELEQKCKMMKKQHTYQKDGKEPDMLLKEPDNVGREQEKLNGQHPTMKKVHNWWLQHEQIKVIVIPVVIAIVISITLVIIPTRLQFNLQDPTSEEYLVMMTKSRQISMYNDSNNNWRNLMNVPDWVDDVTSWYASEHRIIIAGGFYMDNSANVAVLDIKSRRVKELRRLPSTQGQPGVFVDGDEVYIIGGWDSTGSTATNTTYYTNMTQNNGWTTLPTMPTATSASVISADSDHIYVFGGYPDRTLTQIYNKHTQQWSRGATIPARCNMYRGRCIKEGHTFIIITADTMMMYSSYFDIWSVAKQYTAYGLHTLAVSYKGDILSCGIHKNKISRYDPYSDDVWVETDIDVSNMAYQSHLFKLSF